jgi:multiple sugar transport system substrate-binding protein
VDDFYANSLATVRLEGKLTSIPVITEQEVVYYRRDLFKQAGLNPPQTMEELEAAARRFHDPSHGMYGFVARGLRAAAVTQFSSFLYSFGGDWVTRGKASINTPEAIAAFNFYGRMLRQYGPPGALNMHWPQAIALFAQGRAAIYIDASSLYPNLTDPAKSVVVGKVGFARFPAGPAKSRPYTVVPWAIAISSGSRHKEAAWEFVRWATSKEIVTRTQGAGNPGARPSVYATAEGHKAFPTDWIDATTWANYVGVPYDRPVVIHVGEARDVIGNLITASIEGRDLKALADKANADFQALIDSEAR